MRSCEPARYSAIAITSTPETRVRVSWLRSTVWPSVVEISPRITNTTVNPATNRPVSITIRRSWSLSWPVSVSSPTERPVMRLRYAGTIGSTHGERNETIPPPKAMRTLTFCCEISASTGLRLRGPGGSPDSGPAGEEDAGREDSEHRDEPDEREHRATAAAASRGVALARSAATSVSACFRPSCARDGSSTSSTPRWPPAQRRDRGPRPRRERRGGGRCPRRRARGGDPPAAGRPAGTPAAGPAGRGRSGGRRRRRRRELAGKAIARRRRGGSPVPNRQPSTSPSWTRTAPAPAREYVDSSKPLWPGGHVPVGPVARIARLAEARRVRRGVADAVERAHRAAETGEPEHRRVRRRRAAAPRAR